MKNICLLLPLIALLFCSCAQTKSRESFQGIITYKITITPETDNNNYILYQKEKYGDKLKVYFSKNGSFKREFLTSGQKGFSFFTYNALTNRCFIKWNNIDTIFSSSCSENSLTLLEEKDLANETILEQLCSGYFISGVDPKGGQSVSMKYYYPKDKEYINPNLYKEYNDGFYNKVIDKMKAPYYKLIMDMGKYTVTFDIEEIENSNVDSGIFNLPTNFPLKEM